MTAPADQARSSLALTRLGSISVAIDAERVVGFLEPGAQEADCDLAALLGITLPGRDDERLLELSHACGKLVVAIHGPVRMSHSEVRLPRYRPTLIAGALRRACVHGVILHESELVYLLDVDAVAARVETSGKEQTACESD